MVSKEELVQVHRLLDQIKMKIEDEAEIEDLEEYAQTTYLDELRRFKENKGEEVTIDDTAGTTYNELGVKGNHAHKGRDAHRFSVLALGEVIASAMENSDLVEAVDLETRQTAKQITSRDIESFRDY